MTNHEIYEKLSSSKVYIDFGNHPGKDRFPREAATCGCCIITGRRGAANYFEDVPIPEAYKFNDNDSNIDYILKKIDYCLKYYDKAINDFQSYRDYIKHEKSEFQVDCKKIFGD